MLQTKFRGNRPTHSGKEDFKGFLTYVGMAAILVMGSASCHQLFISLYLKAFIKVPEGFHKKFGSDWQISF